MCMLRPNFFSDYMSRSDHKHNFLFLEVPCDFPWTHQQSVLMCWSQWSKPGPTLHLSVDLWVTMRSCYGGHFLLKGTRHLAFSFTAMGQFCKFFFGFVNGFILFFGCHYTFSCKLPPLWLICGSSSISWCDARWKLLGVKTADNMWFSCPGSGSGWAAVAQHRCLQQCQMRSSIC